MKYLIQKTTAAFFIIFLVTVFNVAAQSYKDKGTQMVHVYGNESVTAEVLSKAKPIEKVDLDKEYSWYRWNEIISTQGGYEGKLLHGQYSSFYPNNNLKEKGNYKMGLKSGKWIKWHNNGIIEEVSNWKKGLKQGWVQKFSASQELVTKSHYKDNKLHGEVITYTAGKVTGKKKYKNGVEIISKESAVKKQESELGNPETEKVKEIASPQDSVQNNKAPVKRKPEKKKP